MSVINRLHRERGAALVISLIMLLLVTLLASVSSSSVQTNLKVLQNIEARALAENAAISAIDEIIAVNDVTNSGGTAFESANVKFYDATGDGVALDELRVEVTNLLCVTIRPVYNSELDPLDPADQTCIHAPGTYECAEVLWEIDVAATDEVTGASVLVRQGLEKRDDKNNLTTCI